MVKRRKEAMDKKLTGDICFARNMLSDALKAYEEAVEIDAANEYAFANMGVIYLKRADYDKCLEVTETALGIVEHFQSDTRAFQQDNQLEVKLLQRRAKCFEVKEEFEKAKADLDRAALLDQHNGGVKVASQRVQQKLSTIRFEEYRTQANDFLKAKKFTEALQMYEKCLKITRQATTLDNVAIFVNKIACLLASERHS